MTILLAEDENRTRMSIARMLESIDGVDIVDQASDGEIALKLLSENTYDVLITDICMPGVSGLDIIRFIRERNLDMELVIMSGYNNFEYARRALRYQVMDYILKPVNPNELKALITSLKDSITSKSFHERSSRSSFFNKLINGTSLSTQSLFEEMSALRIPTDANLYMISFLMFENGYTLTPSELNELLHVFLKKERTTEVRPYEFTCHGFGSAILFMFYDVAQNRAIEITEEISERLSDYIKKKNQEVSVIVSAFPVISLQRISEVQSYARQRAIAEIDFSRPFILAQEDSMTEKEVASLVQGLDRQLEKLNTIIYSSPEEIECYIDEVIRMFKDISLCSQVEEEKYQSRLKLILGKMLAEENSSDELNYSLKMFINSYKLINMKKNLRQILLQLNKIKQEQNIPISELICTHIIERIKKNIAEENFTVKDAISGLNYSENYIRYIFSNHEGLSIKRYIINEKMRRAKELLSEGMQVKKVAELTGYNNQRYFASSFKNYTGLTPSEWRDNNPE